MVVDGSAATCMLATINITAVVDRMRTAVISAVDRSVICCMSTVVVTKRSAVDGEILCVFEVVGH